MFKANSTARKYKEIRIPEAIHDHDLFNKANNILAMVRKGETKIKVYSENDSEKSSMAIRKLCQYVGKEAHLNIQLHEVKPKARKKDSVKVERWIVELDFEKEAVVNYEQVNRKWRRFLMKQKMETKLGKDQPMKGMDSLSDCSIDAQREILKDMRKYKVQLPKEFEEYGRLEDSLEQGNFFGVAISNAMQKYYR